MPGIDPVILDGAVEVRVLTTFNGTTLTAAAFTAGVDITCDLLGDGLNRSMNENAVVIDRLCSRQTGENPGSYSESVELTYAWDPQSVLTTTAYATLVPYSTKYLAIRYGIAEGTPAVAGQKVDVVTTKPGQRQRVPVARNEESRVTQKQFIPAGGVVQDIALT